MKNLIFQAFFSAFHSLLSLFQNFRSQYTSYSESEEAPEKVLRTVPLFQMLQTFPEYSRDTSQLHQETANKELIPFLLFQYISANEKLHCHNYGKQHKILLRNRPD
ncbi:MAG: hypothetical protein IJW23_08140 [Lentisphaeria bacterium]|nr:hypothetical protein [Lentisphaeria bacterium]